MSIRGGGSPRDDRRGQPSLPSWRASNGRGEPPRVSRYRAAEERGRLRIPGVLKFLLFAGVLAAFVLVLMLTALRPLVRTAVVDWAWDNPSWITRIGFVDDMVREDLDGSLTAPGGTSSTQQTFDVQPGDTVEAIGLRLQQAGIVTDWKPFVYAALHANLQPQLQSGTFLVEQSMTPAQLVTALIQAKLDLTTVNVTFREGIRLEQMTALLETIDSKVDPKAYYDLAMHPTQELLDAYPWLQQAGLPKGASLEGFLYPATYTLITATNGGPYQVTDAEALIRMQLDKFYQAVGQERLNVPASRKMNFFQIVTLASIVQHETAKTSEYPLVAGVYQNRLDRLNGFAPLMGSEPTVIYAVDTANLRNLPFIQWQTYFFWNSIQTKIADVSVPKDLQGYQTYQTAGLIPGPISTPTEAEIDAALNPDTSTGYLYFLALPDKSGNVFSKTLAEQNANIKKYYPNGFGG